MKNPLSQSRIAFTALLLLTCNAYTQWTPKTAEALFTEVAPVIDGTIDNVWNSIEEYEIDVPFNTEVVSIFPSASFKALWDYENIYFLVEVPDDDFYPCNDAGVNHWLADKPELYFDVNESIVEEGEIEIGPMYANSGHFQVAPYFEDLTFYDFLFAYDENISAGDGTTSYFVEYSVPFYMLIDRYENYIDPLTKTMIGFDVTVIDQDEATSIDPINRINWSNNCLDTREGGISGESWSSLDAAGELTFGEGEPHVDTNEAPIANAGPDKITPSNEMVILDGTGSSDPNGDYIYYNWYSLDNRITLNASSSATPNFISPATHSEAILKFVLIVFDGHATSVPDTVAVFVNGTSANENTKLVNIKVSPNPASNYLTINVDDVISQDLVFTLSDLSGRKIISSVLTEKNTKISLSEMGLSGIYVVLIEDKIAQKSYTQKIIIE